MPHVDLSGFPKLKIDPRNVFGSCSSFRKKFEVELRFKITAAGNRVVRKGSDEEKVEVFDD